MAEDAYCTLVLSDSYLPGAAVLAHSLRDAGTTKKLAALITLDTLSADAVTELKELYDYLIPVQRIGNPRPGNLFLMDRGDLAYTFTKIALWRQIQFRKIVYIDADVVALRAPDELFAIEAPFAAAPDVGWPDAFNSGVMVLSPNMGDFWALQTLASSGDSFDGADQGLLNQYYEHRNWHRISFAYNCTPNAQYQWEPAYRYYKSNISMVHFIGRNKPWSRDNRPGGGAGVYNELLAKWWAVYDRHLKAKAQQYDSQKVMQVPNQIQQHVESKPGRDGHVTEMQHMAMASEAVGPSTATEIPLTDPAEAAQNIDQGIAQTAPVAPPRKFSAPQMEWDATRSAPPPESRPEASNFPSETYTFSESKELFQAPVAYPEPPKDMWYEVPKTKPKVSDEPKPIFPWEKERPKARPTRVFAEDAPQPKPEPEVTPEPIAAVKEEEPISQASTATPPPPPEDPWQSFGQSKNAWDSVPGIERYVRAVLGAQTKKARPTSLSLESISQSSDILSPTGEGNQGKEDRESLILTDFPTAVERPSLPVTPAPIRRPTFWGEEKSEKGQLPSAEGVPDQAEWDPAEKLDELRRSSLLEIEHLKKASAEAAKPTPLREFPEHSYPRERRRSHEAVHHNLPPSGESSPLRLPRNTPQAEGTAAEPSSAAGAGVQQGVETEQSAAAGTEAPGAETSEGKPVFAEPDFKGDSKGDSPAAAPEAIDASAETAAAAHDDVLSPTGR